MATPRTTGRSGTPARGAASERTTVEIPARAWRALAVGSAGFSLVSFNTTATNLAFGDISDTFSSASAATVSWVASIFFIGMASLLLVSGRLADRVGRRRVFRAGLVTFAIGALLSAIAPTVYVLIAARLVAVGRWRADHPQLARRRAARVPPRAPLHGHLDVGGDRAPGLGDRARGGSADPGGQQLAGAVRGLRARSRSPRSSSAGRRWASPGPNGAPVPSTWSGWWSAPSPSPRWSSRSARAATSAGTARSSSARCSSAPTALPLFLRRCRRHPEPLLNLHTFLLPPVWLANLANFLLNLAGMATWLIWPLFMERVWGFSKLAIGLGLMPGPVVSGIITTVGGRLSERHGHETMVRWGSLVPIVAMIWPLVFLTESPDYWLGAAPAIALFGAGWALTQPPLNSGVMAQVHPDAFGEVNAAFNTVRNIAGALGIALAIAILGDTSTATLDDYEHVFLFFMVAVVACWLVLFFVYPRVSRRWSASADRGVSPLSG